MPKRVPKVLQKKLKQSQSILRKSSKKKANKRRPSKRMFSKRKKRKKKSKNLLKKRRETQRRSKYRLNLMLNLATTSTWNSFRISQNPNALKMMSRIRLKDINIARPQSLE